MIINGPFESGVNYLEEQSILLSDDDPEFEIQISDTNLYSHRYISFFVKQELKISHAQIVQILIKIGDNYEALPLIPSPNQVYEYIEYRYRLPSRLVGTNGLSLLFRYYVMGKSLLHVKNLTFGEPAEVDLNNGFNLQVSGPGITSPMPGWVPMAVDDIIDLKFHPYALSKPVRAIFQGDIYDENGKKYPEYYDITSDIKIKWMSQFDKGKVIVYFGRIDV